MMDIDRLLKIFTSLHHIAWGMIINLGKLSSYFVLYIQLVLQTTGFQLKSFLPTALTERHMILLW